VTGTRLALAIVLGIGLAAPAAGWGDGGGLFGRKPKLDPARVRQLTEIVRLDPDEKRRKGAVLELAGADPRLQVEVMPALIAALRKDTAAPVRAAAAEVIGRFNVLFPTAGLALEDATEADPSPEVRGAAKQALWEYHLIGYRSARGAGGFAGQTAEPPIAGPARPPEPVTSEPPTAAAVTVLGPDPTPALAPLPPVGPPPGPRVPVLPQPVTTALLAVPPHPNLTVEPPLAKPPATPVSVPVATAEPPIRPRWPEPVTVGKPPPIALALPSIVSDPGSIPGVTPFQEPTAEPPIRKRSSPPAVPTPTLAAPPSTK
jgi:hypothetical protein